ncbi:MAG: S23 ribosomal protein [Candidatus Woesebacteria bacterium GW2011_GWB1_38_8]|uniref:S23 ribosomal protein n=1 Tax=Candidatus Woesebacteria bacterium GW2011_GWB1_38_8 TaxID=1618570 RepID=A0A0G0KX09_9BACT|nr:MAG: S23 ribosomal protein [Candidatus Woesebacteria bacterium GW2011_GWB1_38_8]
MTDAKSIEDIEVYKESLLLTKEVFNLCKHYDLKREYSLCDQIKRASISVCANISEGYGRRTRADFSQFLSISLGSCNEVLALLDIVKINFPKIDTDLLKQRYKILSKRLFSFRRNLQ